MNHDTALTTINERLFQRYLRAAAARKVVVAQRPNAQLADESDERSFDLGVPSPSSRAGRSRRTGRSTWQLGGKRVTGVASVTIGDHAKTASPLRAPVGPPKASSSDGCSSEGSFYSPAIAETAGLSCTGMPLRIDCPTTASTSPSSVQSFMDTPACAAATFCQRRTSLCPQPCGKLTTPCIISSVTWTGTGPR